MYKNTHDWYGRVRALYIYLKEKLFPLTLVRSRYGAYCYVQRPKLKKYQAASFFLSSGGQIFISSLLLCLFEREGWEIYFFFCVLRKKKDNSVWSTLCSFDVVHPLLSRFLSILFITQLSLFISLFFFFGYLDIRFSYLISLLSLNSANCNVSFLPNFKYTKGGIKLKILKINYTVYFILCGHKLSLVSISNIMWKFLRINSHHKFLTHLILILKKKTKVGFNQLLWRKTAQDGRETRRSCIVSLAFL